MRFILSFSLLLLFLSVSAGDRDTTTVFLDKFEKFVTSIENNDSAVNWEKSNTEYKALRMEYRDAHKNRMSDDQYARYNKLKTRYVKQVSLKKVSKDIKSKTSSISSAVSGVVEGIVGK